MAVCYVWPVRIYYEDTDHGGVVYYANYLKFMERARTEFLREKGVNQSRLIDEHDLLFAVHRVEANYFLPAKFNQLLLVTAEVSQSSRIKLEFKQQVYQTELNISSMTGYFADSEKLQSHPENRLLCEAKINIASLNASQLQPKRISKKLFEELMREQ